MLYQFELDRDVTGCAECPLLDDKYELCCLEVRVYETKHYPTYGYVPKWCKLKRIEGDKCENDTKREIQPTGGRHRRAFG